MLRKRLLTNPVTSATKMLLHFDGNLNDSSIYNHKFTGTNNLYTTGKFGQCSLCSLEGTYSTGYHAMESSGAHAYLHNRMVDYTAEFWCDFSQFTEDTQNIHLCLSKNASYDSMIAIDIQKDGATLGVFRIYIRSLNYTIGSSLYLTDLIGWKHICIQKTNGYLYFYIDGVQKWSNTFSNSTTPVNTSTHIYTVIGDIGSGEASGITTKIDEFRLSEGVMYNISGFTPPTAPYA